jgi:hypothetical protein
MTIIPNTDDTPFIRTDFSHDAAWSELVAAVETPSEDGFRANLCIVNQPDFQDLDATRLRGLATDTDHAALFVADEIAMTDPEHPVLCIELLGRGRSFRIVPEELWEAERNLSLASMDFGDFADAVDDDGVFRGF